MMKYKDITGERFGKLTVQCITSERYYKSIMWRCYCDCGNSCLVSYSKLTCKKGNTKSCGCLRRERSNIENKRFGRLVAQKRGNLTKQGWKWICKCDCGNTKETLLSSLRSGRVISCGCAHRKDYSDIFLIDKLYGKTFWRVKGKVIYKKKTNGGYKPYIKCECSFVYKEKKCGNTQLVDVSQLLCEWTTKCIRCGRSGRGGRTSSFSSKVHKSFNNSKKETLYWVGIMMSDGCIQINPKPRISLGLIDKEHILKFKNFVFGSEETTITVTKGTKNLFYTIRLSSKEAVKDLGIFGVIPNKGTNNDLKVSNIASNSLDFWRGMVDGDGSIGPRRLTLSGRKTICEYFLKFIFEYIELVPSRQGNKYRFYMKENKCCSVNFSGINAAKVCKLLYSSSTEETRLNRKYVRAVNLMDKYLYETPKNIF